MVPIAPAWEDNRPDSIAEPLAGLGQRNTNAATKTERQNDLCYPDLAARITQDAERLCSQQVSLVSHQQCADCLH